MTPAQLAALHAACFQVPRPYSETEFAAFLSLPGCFLCPVRHGFALGRVVLDEAELLTLAVDPAHRQKGVGQSALAAFEAQATKLGAGTALLEVAANNRAALALYHANHYTESGRRPGYYRLQSGDGIDAILMSKPLDTA